MEVTVGTGSTVMTGQDIIFCTHVYSYTVICPRKKVKNKGYLDFELKVNTCAENVPEDTAKGKQ